MLTIEYYWAAVKPVNYECSLDNLIDAFAMSKILFTEKLISGVLVTATPDLVT